MKVRPTDATWSNQPSKEGESRLWFGVQLALRSRHLEFLCYEIKRMRTIGILPGDI